MGRPKEHDARTAAKLLAVAERIVETEGEAALSLRRIAADSKTTTRAVYSLFGARDGLLAALGIRAFELLGGNVASLGVTDDPAADLVAAGLVFRTFAVRHPALFALAVQVRTTPSVAAAFRVAQLRALSALRARIERLEQTGLLGERSVRDAIFAFHAHCEGLAAIELRGVMPRGDEKRLWCDALGALVAGFAAAARRPRRARARTKGLIRNQ